MNAKMKKMLSTVLVIALTAAISIGGTLAYLTDRDSKANVFTVGDVEIELNEEFEKGATLTPGVDINKDVTITNTGRNEAWVWYTYAIPTLLDNEDASKNVVHINHAGKNWLKYRENKEYWDEDQTEATPADQCWIPDYAEAKDVKINEISYNVYAVLYNGKLDVGETTTVGMTNVYMDTNVDIDPEGKWYVVENGVAKETGWGNENGNPIIYVSAYAIQTEGFETVEAAYAAYNQQWTTKEGVNNGLEYAPVTVERPASGAVRPAGYAPKTDGEEINGLTILDGSDAETNLRALYKNGMTGDLSVNDSLLDGTYAMNVTAVEDSGAKLSAENTTFMGWTSYSGWDSATFKNCTFKLNSEGTYNYVRAYDQTTFEDCEFTGTTIDIAADGSIELKNCTYNGELITSIDQIQLDADYSPEKLNSIKENINISNN